MDRAFDVLAEMRAELHPIDPDHVTVGALMKACARAGQVLCLAIFAKKFGCHIVAYVVTIWTVRLFLG